LRDPAAEWSRRFGWRKSCCVASPACRLCAAQFESRPVARGSGPNGTCEPRYATRSSRSRLRARRIFAADGETCTFFMEKMPKFERLVIKLAPSGNSTIARTECVRYPTGSRSTTRMPRARARGSRACAGLKHRSKVLPLAYEILLLVCKQEDPSHSSCAKVRGPTGGTATLMK
jgi:hypothetical protein